MLLHVDTSRVIVGMGCSSWPQSRWPLSRLFLCSYCLMAFVGCAGEDALDRLNQAIPERERQKVVALAGTISLDGQPAPNLMVRLVMEGETAPGPTSPKSLTDANGKFEFTTYLAGDGVPTGKYAVIVEQLTKSGTAGWSGPDQLKNRFNHVKEPAATLEVKSGEPQKDVKIDLVTADKKPKPAPRYSASVATGKPIKKMGKR